jgi:hypothetical protein
MALPGRRLYPQVRCQLPNTTCIGLTARPIHKLLTRLLACLGGLTNTRDMTNRVMASGGSTSAETLIKAAHIVLDNCGIRMSPSWVSRLVRTYKHRVERNGFPFIDFLANAVQLSAEQRRTALQNPDIACVITYADPTGETAVRNVMRDEAA